MRHAASDDLSRDISNLNRCGARIDALRWARAAALWYSKIQRVGGRSVELLSIPSKPIQTCYGTFTVRTGLCMGAISCYELL
jgi:hypothetical protein